MYMQKGQVSFCHHLTSVVRRKFSHLNLLFRNHWADCNQNLVEWSLDGPLPNVCPVIPTSNQYGRQAKYRKKGDAILIASDGKSSPGLWPDELKRVHSTCSRK
jgi:hypothetical protein